MEMIRKMKIRKIRKRKQRIIKIIAEEVVLNHYLQRIGELCLLSRFKDLTRDPYLEIKANHKIPEKQLLIKEMRHPLEIKRRL